ncbi:helix-turn-helix domain-containing protein [Nucisporomicrobium flavum]|uniref:helix-turn-helix domain-containing protein n=1 Tax=Nucisporomicrobium flavum TaxID=2785915 RepID=UPI0018F2DD24|nr:helix-turn-helix domain-containing protein [Nucisporomicrobium flavum]
MSSVGRTPSSLPRFLSVAETAKTLGMSEMTLYRAIKAGEFPAVRIRGRLIVPSRVLEELANAAVTENGEVNAAAWTGNGLRAAAAAGADL